MNGTTFSAEFPAGFTVTPRWLTLLDLPAPEFKLLHLYAEFASVSQDFLAKLSDARAAMLLKVSDRHVKSTKAKLKHRGFITVPAVPAGMPAPIKLNWSTIARHAHGEALIAGLNVKAFIESSEPTVQGSSEAPVHQLEEGSELPLHQGSDAEVHQVVNPEFTVTREVNKSIEQETIAPPKTDGRVRNIFAYYQAQAIRELGFKPPMNGSAAGPLIKRFLREHDETDAFTLIDWVLAENNDYLAKGGKHLHMIFDTYCVGEWLGSQNEREPAEEPMTEDEARDAALAQRTREAYEQGRAWSPLQGKPDAR